MGCDGVAASGARVDACGACGGGDDSCAGPYRVAAPPAACLSSAGGGGGGARGAGEVRLAVRWSGPSNHSAHDRIGVYGPDPAGGALVLWSGRCDGGGGDDGGGGAACVGDGGCAGGAACRRLDAVPGGAAAGALEAVASPPGGLAPPYAVRVRYLRCMGPADLGLCAADGYAVAAEAEVVVAAGPDACGVCGGDNSTCAGCDGAPRSGAAVDACGVCGGDNATCAGCDGVPRSGAAVDRCGVCGGDDSACAGCDGVPHSGAAVDACGACGGDGSGCAWLRVAGAAGAAGAPLLCAGEALAVEWGLPAERLQAALVLETADGLWRGFALAADSSACRNCPRCADAPAPAPAANATGAGAAAADVPPLCARAGCAGCPVRGTLVTGAGTTPPGPGAYSLSLVAVFAAGRPDQAAAVPLAVGGRRDACGVCGGDNGTCVGCDGVAASGAAVDRCGRCGPPGPAFDACVGCDGVPHSGAARDACGVCGGDNASCRDCLGVPHGGAAVDGCGACAPAGGGCGAAGHLVWIDPARPPCAGAPLAVRFRAPRNRSAGDRLRLFRADLGSVPVAADRPVPAGGADGAVEFDTALLREGDVVHARCRATEFAHTRVSIKAVIEAGSLRHGC